jgi:hypothetical protein
MRNGALDRVVEHFRGFMASTAGRASARFGGFSGRAVVDIGRSSSPVSSSPSELEGDLRRPRSASTGLSSTSSASGDRDLPAPAAAEQRRGQARRLGTGAPSGAYGFEDLTGARVALLEALAGPAEVTVSLSVRAGPPRLLPVRGANGLHDLVRARANRGIEELPPRPVETPGGRSPHLGTAALFSGSFDPRGNP